MRKVTYFGVRFLCLALSCLLSGVVSAGGHGPGESNTKVDCYFLLDGEPQTKKILQMPVQLSSEAMETHTMTTSYNTYLATAEVSATAEVDSSEVKISAYVTYSLENQDSGAVKVSGLNEIDVSMGSTQLRCAIAGKL